MDGWTDQLVIDFLCHKYSVKECMSCAYTKNFSDFAFS